MEPKPTLQEIADKELSVTQDAKKTGSEGSSTQEVKTPASPTSPPKEDADPHLKSLRTFQGDIEEALGKNHGSLATIAIAEQKRKEETIVVPDPKQEIHREVKNKFFVFVGLSLFLLGFIVVGIVYYDKAPKDTVPPAVQATLLTYSSEKDISLQNTDREKLLLTLNSERQAFKLPINSVLYLNLVDGNKTSSMITDVAPLLFPHAPPALTRALNDRYMIGVYAFETNEPFIILTTNDYPASYAGMLKWEGTLKEDVGVFFSRAHNATTSLAFEDEALRNKDLRILKNEKGEVVLLYSFVDRNTLIITSNEKIFTAVLGKYLINQTVSK
jgi:hypothetical protein